MKKAVFLDRDGVINEPAPEGSYITKWEELRLLPGVAAGIASLNRAGYTVIVVTNQRCVAKGLLSTAELEILHERLIKLLAQSGATIDGVYYCPHELDDACACRKPRPGMLLEAARAHNIDISSAWMIGDSDIDIEAGRNAGCKTIRLLERIENSDQAVGGSVARTTSDMVAISLLDAAQKILQLESTDGDKLLPARAQFGAPD